MKMNIDTNIKINQAIRYWKKQPENAEAKSVKIIIADLEKKTAELQQVHEELIEEKGEELRLSRIVVACRAMLEKSRHQFDVAAKNELTYKKMIQDIRETLVFIASIAPKHKRMCRKYNPWNQYCAGYDKALNIMLHELLKGVEDGKG